MFDRVERRHHHLLIVATAFICFAGTDLQAQWSQFGGPNQRFSVEDVGIAEAWPAEGPEHVWSRPLGPGYSSIVAKDDRLFTMYRDGKREVVISLDAATGKMLWEYRYESTPVEGHLPEYGDGPNATPLLADGRVFTIGVASVMQCLDAETGRVLWSHDLWREFGGNMIEFGYSSSPIEYGDAVIALVGGKDASIVALDKKDGAVVWKNLSFKNSFSSPIIMNLGGRDQVVTFTDTEVIGVDPQNGSLVWHYPSVNEWKQNISMPVQVGDDLLFVSSFHAGTRCLRVTMGEPARVEEVWSTRKVEIFYTNAVQIGDYVYGGSGDQSATLLFGINAKTGKIAWRERGFGWANLVAVGRHLAILDVKGYLALATPEPDGLKIHSKIRLLKPEVRAAPTVVGNRLYVRDGERAMALDLGHR
jgi:outer membrane protein assembly factor BamB